MTAQRFEYYTPADVLRRRTNRVSDTRKIEALKMFLPELDGMVGQNPCFGRFHIGSDRPMCGQHEIRLPKMYIKYRNLKGNMLGFLNQLVVRIKPVRACKRQKQHTFS